MEGAAVQGSRSCRPCNLIDQHSLITVKQRNHLAHHPPVRFIVKDFMLPEYVKPRASANVEAALLRQTFAQTLICEVAAAKLLSAAA
jgi:hypothetical protein